VKKAYMQWLDSGKPDGMYRKMIEEIDEEGGLGPELSLPVEIVGHGRARARQAGTTG